MQLKGLVAVAEFTSRFEADAAVGRLLACGVEAMVLSDTAHQIAPHMVTIRGHQVLVTEQDRLRASRLLSPDQDLVAAVQRRKRPRWQLCTGYVLAAATVGLPVVMLVSTLVRALI